MWLKRRSDPPPDEYIDMAPMVDIVFQLMAFLLFSLELTGKPPVEMPEARNGLGVNADDATAVALQVGQEPGESIVALIENQPLDRDAVMQRIRENIDQGRVEVVIQADGRVPYGVLYDWAGEIGAIEGAILKLGVQDPDN